MFKRFILITAVVAAALFATSSLAYTGLPEAVQAARDILSQPSPDPESCSGLAAELVDLCKNFPNSSLVPEGAWLAAQLFDRMQKPQEAVAAAKQALAQGTPSSWASAAFDYVWSKETNQGANNDRATDLVRAYTSAVAGNPRAAEYLRTALMHCRATNRTEDFCVIGTAYLSLKNTPNDPVLLLEIGETALQGADHDLARAAYQQFAGRHADLPQCVTAWSRLGDLALASGDANSAQVNYAWAWSAYQKNRKDAAYRQPEIAQAAAHSLWMLQKPKCAEYDQLTAIETLLNENRARRMADDLVAAYTEVMLTDPLLAPQALQASGNVHRRLGDALLKEGFRRNLAAQSGTTPPYAEAMPEYVRAMSAYQQASDRASAAQSVRQNAAVQAFEVACGQGDAVFGWAIEMMRRAPGREPGGTNRESRLDYFANTVCPLLEEGLQYKNQALALTSTLPIEQYAGQVRESLDLPLRTPLMEMAGIMERESRSLASAATELGQSFRYGFKPASATPLVENLERVLADASSGFKHARRITRCYQLLQPNLGASARPFWDNLLASTYQEYAAACRAVKDQMALASTHLSNADDEPVVNLLRRVNRAMSTGSREEWTTLTQWHELAANSQAPCEAAERMLARLAELDPEQFGTDGSHHSASRKKQ